MSRTFAALAHRNYRWFLSGQAVTNIGTWMQRIAQDWLVLEITGGDAVALGLVTALQFLPFVVLAPVVGVVADRYPRRWVLTATGTLGAVAAGALAVATLAGVVNLPIIFVAGAALGVAAAFDHPARQALVGQVVPRESLANAVALNSATFNLARIIGPSLAGIVIAVSTTGVVFGVNAVSFLAAVGTLWRLRLTSNEPVSADRSPVTFGAGLRYLRARPDLVVVIAMVGVAAVFAFNFGMTTALMATEEFGRGAAQFGMLSTTLALGSITGSLLSARRRRPINVTFVAVAGVLFGLATALGGLMPTFGLFALSLPLCGFTALTFSVGAQSYLQLHTAPEMRGRVMGIYALVFFGSNPVGAPVLGLLSAEFGPRAGLIGGGMMAAVGLSAIALWALRRGVFQRSGALTPADPGAGAAVVAGDAAGGGALLSGEARTGRAAVPVR